MRMSLSIILFLITVFLLSSSLALADSLASESQGGNTASIFGAKTACSVGDILTLQFNESSTTTFDASDNLAKKSTANLTQMRNTPDYAGLFGALFGTILNADNSHKNTHSASIKQTYTATMEVRVTDVLPGGNLAIEGIKTFKYNNEVQIVKIKGTIRQIDIDPTNTIPSTKVANAEILCDGLGRESNKRKSQGIFQQLLRIFF